MVANIAVKIKDLARCCILLLLIGLPHFANYKSSAFEATAFCRHKNE
jgi:hypothetical protein